MAIPGDFGDEGVRPEVGVAQFAAAEGEDSALELVPEDDSGLRLASWYLYQEFVTNGRTDLVNPSD
jgi:hypothetical protein